MSLLTTVQDVCTVVGVAVPTSVIAAIGTNRTMQEMLNCANVMAQRTAYDTRDWTELQTSVTFTGDGTTTAWPLPSNYKRMLKTAQLRRSDAPRQPMRFISDYDEWLMRRAGVEEDSRGEWIKIGGEILIYPALVTGVTATFPYLERNTIALTSSGYGDRFLSDNDTFRLDERLLQLGMIWQWKAWKGSPYAEDMGTWSDAIAMEMGSDKPAPIIIGHQGISHGNPSYPYPSDQSWDVAAMSAFAAFRRQPVQQQVAQNLRTITIPAPTRGIILSENEAFMQPGAAQVQINWASTMKGVKLRGGCERWCELPETTPVISAFEYVSGTVERMYAGNETKLYDVTTSTPVLVKSGQASGNYCAVQFSNMGGDWMVVVNDAGDFVLRTDDGTTFTTLSGTIGAGGDGADNITYDPADLPTGVAQGEGLVYVWKYRNRLFFIQQNSMNAWYLGIDAVGGALQPIYLSGAAQRGGKLLFGATWSIDAGDGIDDKCVFVTDLGELLIFTGSNPGDSANWRQEGRYQIGPPLGMNAHMLLGGDLIIATVDGLTPVSAAIQKDSGALDLALLTRPIKPLWRTEVTTSAKRAFPWTLKKWDEYGAIFVTTPMGNSPSTTHCLVANNETGAWFLYTWDATCFLRMRADMFFGTQGGIIMQADRTGYDDGLPYVATLVGGWELFQSGAAQTVWHQARVVFSARNPEPFQPQLASTVDYVVTIPPPPPPGADPGVLDVWDEGLWDTALWDAAVPATVTRRNTMWVSIGMSGFAHAPIVQVTVAQEARPRVELIAISTTQESGGVNV